MNLLVSVFVYLSFFGSSLAKQCRYVTVLMCDSESASSSAGNLSETKGKMGERGFIGKSGPRGETGSQDKQGMKGNTASIEELKEELSSRLNETQETLNELLLPPTCASSSLVGYQTLRSGKQVYCDGGWMVFQKRYDGSVNFQRRWNDYKNGFGNFSTEFWLGLDQIHNATVGRGCRLRVDIWGFDDDHAYAEYSEFFVESEADLYRLHIDGYSGTAGNCFTQGQSHQIADGMSFTTLDRDNDRYPRGNCAIAPQHGPGGGWWFNACQNCKLNAAWGRGNPPTHNIFWRPWKGERTVLKATTMKLRCD